MNATNAVQRTRATLRLEQPPETLLTNLQRRVVLALFAAGMAYLLVGLLLVPHGVVFWLAFVALPPLAGGLAALFGGNAARPLDAWLLRGGAAPSAGKSTPAVTLPEMARSALQVAALPALLGELIRAGATMPEAEKAAAGRLFRAVIAYWNGPADAPRRAALARQVPGLVAGLIAGGAAAIAAADAAVLRLTTPPGAAS